MRRRRVDCAAWVSATPRMKILPAARRRRPRFVPGTTAGRLAWRQRTLTCRAWPTTGRASGPLDSRLTTLRIDRHDGRPLALVVNFQAHPCVHTIHRPFEVTRDVPGEVCDRIERALPGAIAMYIQGACGDGNFHAEFSTPERCHEPADRIATAALACQAMLRKANIRASRPLRSWPGYRPAAGRAQEIDADRLEAEHRLSTGDIASWRAGIGRVMTNRPDDMIARHGGDEAKAVRAMARFNVEWTSQMLVDYETRPEGLESEVQAVRIGDLAIVANASEFFSSLALDVREVARRGIDDRLLRQWPHWLYARRPRRRAPHVRGLSIA